MGLDVMVWILGKATRKVYDKSGSLAEGGGGAITRSKKIEGA